VILQ
jgi:hypothetical protein